MGTLKQFYKRNTHNAFLKTLAGFGRSLNRLYENRNYDVHSNGEEVVLKKLSSFNPAIIIDGGANIGDYSLLAGSHCPSAKIFSFEPVVSTFKLLKHKTANNKNIIAVNTGLYNTNKKQEIKIYDSHTHSSLYEIKGIDYSVQKTEVIELVSGDSFMHENKIEKIDFLKLDIEGAELHALQGFEKALAENKIRMVQFEYGYINITTKNLLIDYYDFFKKHNYLIGKIYPGKVEFRNYKFKHEDFIGPNFIALHASDSELQKSLSVRR